MNKDETIKEILENIKKQNEWKGIEYFRTPLSNENVDKLLDYITNLQQRIQELEDDMEKVRDYIIDSDFYIENDNWKLFNPILKVVNKYHFEKMDRDPSTWIRLERKNKENE